MVPRFRTAAAAVLLHRARSAAAAPCGLRGATRGEHGPHPVHHSPGSAERRRYIERQLRPLCAEAECERVDGVRGTGPRHLRAPSGLRGGHGAEPREFGCTQAHINAAKRVVERGWSAALVAEDDANFELRPRWAQTLEEVIGCRRAGRRQLRRRRAQPRLPGTRGEADLDLVGDGRLPDLQSRGRPRWAACQAGGPGASAGPPPGRHARVQAPPGGRAAVHPRGQPALPVLPAHGDHRGDGEP